MRRIAYMLAAMIFATVLTVAPSAGAQDVEVTGPLAGAPACLNCRQYREFRLQLKPFASFTLQDEFSRTIMFGGQLGFYFTDWLGIEGLGAFAPIHIDTALNDEVNKNGQSTPVNRLSLPSADGFDKQTAEINWMAALQLTFIPLRGKLALFQKLFLDTDFYLFGGVAAVGLEERANVNVASDPSTGTGVCVDGAQSVSQECLDSQSKRSSRTAFAPTFGVGLTLYVAEFIGITLEWRAVPFSWNTSGTDEAGLGADGNPGGDFPDGMVDDNDQLFHFNHMFSIGAAFYLPPKASLSE